MPYTFTSWSSYTDPAGNPRTLDWTEVGMAGQFAGAHLECLRQAAVLRNSVCRAWNPGLDGPVPGEVTLAPVNGLRQVLTFIDRVAWTPLGSEIINGNGWILPSQLQSDYTGQEGVPIWQTVGEMETEIGESRIEVQRLHEIPDAAIRGTWLRQCRECFRRIVYSVGTLELNLASESTETRVGTAATFPGAIANHDAQPWGATAVPSMYPGHAAYYDFANFTVWRRRDAITWRSTWPNGMGYTPLAPPSADLYVVCGVPSGSYENNDLPLAQFGKLYRLHQGADLTGAAANETLADYGAATVATAPTGPGGVGYAIVMVYTVSDWTGWALGA